MPSSPELFIVLGVLVLLFGGSQLPKLARNLAQAQKEFKGGLSESQPEADSPASRLRSADPYATRKPSRHVG
jgi:sec-independent protein translocase protein TatA